MIELLFVLAISVFVTATVALWIPDIQWRLEQRRRK